MKFAILALCLFTVALARPSLHEECNNGDHTNGQPGCQSQEELDIGSWRNNWDPTRYWVCQALGEPAVEVLCEASENGEPTGWFDPEKKCVEWDQWYWTCPSAPLSRP